MRKENVIALLEHATNDLSGSDFRNIEDQYNDALEKKEIPTSLQIDVKNMMENLRSALDYLANDIYDELIHPTLIAAGKEGIKNVYFPYGKTENDFKSSVGLNLPNLENIHPAIYKIIEEAQKHQSGGEWLHQLCSIVNEKKHDKLSPQTREERRSLNMQFPGGASIDLGAGATMSGSGTISSGGGIVEMNNDVISGNSPALNTSGGVVQTVTRWVSFKFTSTNIEVLPLLKAALKNIKEISEKIYSELEPKN